jgi:hypothetical protein
VPLSGWQRTALREQSESQTHESEPSWRFKHEDSTSGAMRNAADRNARAEAQALTQRRSH